LARLPAASIRVGDRAARRSAYQYRLQVRDKEYLLSATGPMVDVPAGGKAEFHEKLFVGPKLQSQLAATGRTWSAPSTWHFDVLAQPCSRRSLGPWTRRQLGLGDHHRHGAD